MTECSILDVGCNLTNFADWLYSFIAPFLNPFLDLATNLINLNILVFSFLINFTTTLYSLGGAVTTFLGFFVEIWASDPIMASIITLISSYVSIVVFIRVWNLFAGVTIWGFKVPRIDI